VNQYWTYCQTSGRVFDPTGKARDEASYSGFGAGRGNPAMEAVKNVGPIPAGFYDIGAPSFHAKLGPCAMSLTPRAGTDTHGRTAFFWHGDNPTHNASHGCVISYRTMREAVWNSGVHILRVVLDASKLPPAAP
jgi:hypothetical protein